jgi:hypothetical protein
VVLVRLGMAVGVGVTVGYGVAEGVGVAVADGVRLGVNVGSGVLVGLGGTLVGDSVDVAVGVAVGAEAEHPLRAVVMITAPIVTALEARRSQRGQTPRGAWGWVHPVPTVCIKASLTTRCGSRACYPTWAAKPFPPRSPLDRVFACSSRQ